MMKFSILVANYNNGKYFKDCYESIINQSYSNWECMIVDDCSTDDSVSLIEDIIKGDPRFTIYKNDCNRGCGYTKKKCIDLSAGEICGFVDPDDALTEQAIERMIHLHEKQPEIALIHSKWKTFKSDGIERVHEKSKQVLFGNYFLNENGEITHFSSFKRKHYDKTTGIDPFLLRAVDLDLYMKLLEVGKSLYHDEILYLYRIHEGGISTLKNEMKAYYWRWFVYNEVSKRRNINLENHFEEKLFKKSAYHQLVNEQKHLQKYKKIDRLYQKLKSLFR